MGASLVSVLATSSGAAVAHAKSGLSNYRIGMFLEIAATVGALAGTLITAFVSPAFVAVVFGLVLLYSAYVSTIRRNTKSENTRPTGFANFLCLNGEYMSGQEVKHYSLSSVPAGFFVMTIAGVFSGLLGIGSGALKVVGMDRIMKVPFKVSTATSNFMIGITAAAGAGVYLHKGYIDPGLSMPVMLGVLAGSVLGGRLLTKVKTENIRIVFAVAIGLIGLEMIYKGMFGKF